MILETDSLYLFRKPLKWITLGALILVIVAFGARIVIPHERDQRIWFYLPMFLFWLAYGVGAWLCSYTITRDGVSGPGRSIRWCDFRAFKRLQNGGIGLLAVEGFYALSLSDAERKRHERCRQKYGVDYVLLGEYRTGLDEIANFVSRHLPEEPD